MAKEVKVALVAAEMVGVMEACGVVEVDMAAPLGTLGAHANTPPTRHPPPCPMPIHGRGCLGIRSWRMKAQH